MQLSTIRSKTLDKGDVNDMGRKSQIRGDNLGNGHTLARLKTVGKVLVEIDLLKIAASG